MTKSLTVGISRVEYMQCSMEFANRNLKKFCTSCIKTDVILNWSMNSIWHIA